MAGAHGSLDDMAKPRYFKCLLWPPALFLLPVPSYIDEQLIGHQSLPSYSPPYAWGHALSASASLQTVSRLDFLFQEAVSGHGFPLGFF